MGIGSITTLRDVRQNLLGFSLDGAARLAGIGTVRLRRLEEDPTEMTMWEAETLGRLYGLSADTLSSVPLHVPREEAVYTLASTDEFRDIADGTRAAVVRAAGAAQDIAWLRELLCIPQPAFPKIQLLETAQPWVDGRAVAEQVRDRYGPGRVPIESMRDWARDYLPGVALLYAHLGDQGPAGLTFAGAKLGPAIVLNLDGKNTNASVRRVSLAHEVYHVLVDWDRVEPLATLSGYLAERGFHREQRANSFAIRFLCPESAVQRLPTDQLEAAQALMLEWGLPYAAARLYLQHQRNADLPPTLPHELRATGAEAKWHVAERADGVAGFPVRAVPPERRTAVARLAAEAYSLAKFPRDRFAELLGVTPLENLEQVLDLFGFDSPASSTAA